MTCKFVRFVNIYTDKDVFKDIFKYIFSFKGKKKKNSLGIPNRKIKSLKSEISKAGIRLLSVCQHPMLKCSGAIKS